MARSASVPSMRVPRSPPARARTRPTGSPMAWPVGSISSAAPMARSASSAPVRVGLRPTFSTTTSLPGTASAAMIRKVADDRSPGTVMGMAARCPDHPVGSTMMVLVAASAATGAPRKRSMRSV